MGNKRKPPATGGPPPPPPARIAEPLTQYGRWRRVARHLCLWIRERGNVPLTLVLDGFPTLLDVPLAVMEQWRPGLLAPGRGAAGGRE